jgi:acetyl esterase/lipase
MLAGRILFIISLLGVIGAVNALARPNHERGWHLRPWWLFAVLTGELVPLRILIHAALLAVLSALGALEHRAGRIGLVLTVVTWAGYAVLQLRAARTKHVMNDALNAAGIADTASPRAPWQRIVTGYPYRVPRTIKRVEDIEYMPGHHMDIYRADGSDLRPAVLQIHGGSWRGGNRRQQARPLLHGLAERGWVTASVSYPLVPAASATDQISALKRAIAWMRTDGPDHGIDPGFIAVTGGSAGGHLAALVALTPNRPEYQPGFEHVDTSVQAAVPLYGIYDLLNRNQTRDDWPIVQRLMRAPRHLAEDEYRAASPLDQVGDHAPPFLIIHGDSDSVVSLAEADQFVAALRARSHHPVVYTKVPGANHAFDLLYSLRSHHVISGIERFLRGVKSGDLRARS